LDAVTIIIIIIIIINRLRRGAFSIERRGVCPGGAPARPTGLLWVQLT
jgi:hypothetical protein